MTAKGKAKRQNNPPKTILVPIDFSSASGRALTHTLGLTNDPSRIILLHVMTSVKEDGDCNRATTAVKERLAELCKDNGITAAGLTKLQVRSGTPFREILNCAEENKVEMIVLAVHSSAALGGIALGHTVDRVSRYASCPVLLVREEEGASVSSEQRR